MVERTGCAGVVVGRACLGRPWFFGQLADAFGGRDVRPEPTLGEVATIAAAHARLLVESIDENRGLRMMRKHLAWYLTSFPVGPAARKRLTSVSTLAELDDALAELDPTLAVTPEAAVAPRGTQTGPHAVLIPEGWLDADAVTPPDALADATVSGG
jgi:tRNA-dihydrouridine synthase